jgi:hypothetical protein
MYEQNYVDLLQASVDLIRQEKLITTLKAENELLRTQLRVAETRRFDSATPALLRPQAG